MAGSFVAQEGGHLMWSSGERGMPGGDLELAIEKTAKNARRGKEKTGSAIFRLATLARVIPHREQRTNVRGSKVRQGALQMSQLT